MKFYGYFSKVLNMSFGTTEVVAWKCSVKNLFLKSSQNSLEKTCAGDSSTDVFLRILQNVSRMFRTAASGTNVLLMNSQ